MPQAPQQQIQTVAQDQSASNLLQHQRNPSNISQVSASPMMNIQEYMMQNAPEYGTQQLKSGSMSFELNKDSS